MAAKEVILLVCVLVNLGISHGFVIPEITLEAYDPKGFRASIPALKGIQMFAFHGNVNKDISQVDPGEYSQDFTSPADNGMWSYYNPDLVLKVGDKVHFWIFIQYEKLGYRKDNQQWAVAELVKQSQNCEKSISVVSGKTVICKDDIVFEDNFGQQEINEQKWSIEQYIPAYTSADFEFVSYQNKPDICYLNNDKLYIKPKVKDDREVNGELDLRGSCTRKTDEECFHKRDAFLIVPPVTSGRIISRFRFRYGKIEVKAKLPAGDWIYPQMYLEQVSDPSRKLWIAYARGNERLLASNQHDIGGRLLFGGPVLEAAEPDRSQYLRTLSKNRTFTSLEHTYTLTWTQDNILLGVDGETYGDIDKSTLDQIEFAENDQVQIVFGVGVGGIHDFPDDYRSATSSGTNSKPWRNQHPKQMKTFYIAKDTWTKTWKLTTDSRAFQIDSVKVWAV